MNQVMEILQRGLYYDPFNLEVNFMLGVASMSLQRFGEGVKYLGKVERGNDKYRKELFMLMAIGYGKTGRNE